MINKIKEFYNRIYKEYQMISKNMTNQWKHWVAGVLLGIFGILMSCVFPSMEIEPRHIMAYSFVVLLAFEFVQANMASHMSKYRLLDSVLDVLVGISGTAIVLYFV